MHPALPDKTYFKIGEVARLADIKTSVLRYWETEFSFLCPEKSSAGQRLYTKENIELVQQIKQMLYQDKYTIEGVRNKFKSRRSAQTSKTDPDKDNNLQQILQQVRQELISIRASL